jgi:hypothetical protein
VLGIQTNLVDLYTSNLTAMATQAALIGGFSFTAVLVAQETGSIAQTVLQYFYYVCFAVCLVCSLFILAEATIVVMFGPTMALKGATDDAVKFAATHMRNQQFVILRAAWAAISALFLGACILSWANYDIGIAAITTVVYLVGYYFLMLESYKAFRIFVPLDENAMVEPTLDGGLLTSGGGGNTYKLLGADEKDGESKQGRTSAAASLAAAQEVLIFSSSFLSFFLSFFLFFLSFFLSFFLHSFRQLN